MLMQFTHPEWERACEFSKLKSYALKATATSKQKLRVGNYHLYRRGNKYINKNETVVYSPDAGLWIEKTRKHTYFLTAVLG